MILNVLDKVNNNVFQFVTDDYYFRSVPGGAEEMVVYGEMMVNPFCNKTSETNAIKTAINSVYGLASSDNSALKAAKAMSDLAYSMYFESGKEPDKFSEKPDCCCPKTSFESICVDQKLNNCDNTVTISEKDLRRYQNLEKEFSKATKELNSLKKEYKKLKETNQYLLENFF